jgi:hypothetical protein
VQDKQAIRDLLKEQFHQGVSPEVLRELNHGLSRGEKDTSVPSQARSKPSNESIFQMAPIHVAEMEF